MTLRGLFRRIKYYWYHKHIFNITNTKFDISYCVFCESFLDDQYGIREFIDRIGSVDRLFFLDLGRNHGFVFYYMMYHIMKTGFTISIVDYYGIEPAPLKFVYFNFLKYISEHSITINYNMIDRAVVFDDAKTIPLRYGENNFGHFNVAGSNYANIDAAEKQSALESVSLSVETIPFSDVIRLLKASKDHDAIIVKIDCKNRTDQMFRAILDELSNCQQRYLLSCERDGSGDRDLSEYVRRGMNVLSTSRTDRPPGL